MKCSTVALKRKLESEDVSSKKSRTESPGASGKATRYALKVMKKYKNGLVIKGIPCTWAFRSIKFQNKYDILLRNEF